MRGCGRVNVDHVVRFVLGAVDFLFVVGLYWGSVLGLDLNLKRVRDIGQLDERVRGPVAGDVYEVGGAVGRGVDDAVDHDGHRAGNVHHAGLQVERETARGVQRAALRRAGVGAGRGGGEDDPVVAAGIGGIAHE